MFPIGNGGAGGNRSYIGYHFVLANISQLPELDGICSGSQLHVLVIIPCIHHNILSVSDLQELVALIEKYFLKKK